jgi:hypothetical protein
MIELPSPFTLEPGTLAYLEQGLGLKFSRYLERLRAGKVLDARTELPS